MKGYRAVMKIFFKTQLVWRFDVIFNMFFTVIKIVFAFVLWGAIFGENNQVAGFTYDEMLSYYIISSFFTQLDNSDAVSGEINGKIRDGTFSLINAINMTVYFFGVLGIPDKIKNGDLDYYITKPSNTLLRLSLENINPGFFPLIIVSILVVLYGVNICGEPIVWTRWVGYAVLVLLMTILYYDIEVILRTTTFFVLSNGNVTRVEELIDLCMKVPGVLFKGGFKVVFYFFLPYGIIATIPTQVLKSTISLQGTLYGVGICILFTIFTIWFWKFGLKHYESASS